MKTYADFKILIYNPKYCGTKWGAIKEDAIKAGFKSWQWNLYQWWFLRKFHFRGIKIFLKKALKFLWYVIVFVGLVILTNDLRFLIKSTTKKNDVITLSYIAHTCTDYPGLCARIADKGGYNLIKGEKQ